MSLSSFRGCFCVGEDLAQGQGQGPRRGDGTEAGEVLVVRGVRKSHPRAVILELGMWLARDHITKQS